MCVLPPLGDLGGRQEGAGEDELQWARGGSAVPGGADIWRDRLVARPPHCAQWWALWCTVCGSFTSTILRQLGKRCKGGPGASRGQQARLQRLLQGKHPTKDRKLASSRLTLDKWQSIIRHALG